MVCALWNLGQQLLGNKEATNLTEVYHWIVVDLDHLWCFYQHILVHHNPPAHLSPGHHTTHDAS